MTNVAVVIPAFNAAAHLPETLASLFAQTFDAFQALIVDDGSADDTAHVAATTGDPRIGVLRVENGGVARARNLGVAACDADLIAFLDADDLWAPTKLERQVEAMHATPEAGICVTGSVQIDAASRILKPMPIWQPDDVCAALLLASMVVGCVSSGMVRRSAFEAVGGFDQRFSQSADWDLWLRLGLESQFVVLDEPLVQYRTSPGNMSSNIRLLERDTFAVLDSFFAHPKAARYFSIRPLIYATHWRVCAGSYVNAGSRLQAVRCLLHALRCQPDALLRPIRQSESRFAQATAVLQEPE